MITAPDQDSQGLIRPVSPSTNSTQEVEKRQRRRQRLPDRLVTAIEYLMHLFVEEDLERGIPPAARIYCAACARERPRAGAIPYYRSLVCNHCATEYEVARAADAALTAGQFVRDKTFGESERYAIPEAGAGGENIDGTAGSPGREEH